MMHYQTMQPSKMLTDIINILKVEAEKEYVEDSNLLIESLKNELISAVKGEKGIVDYQISIFMLAKIYAGIQKVLLSHS